MPDHLSSLPRAIDATPALPRPVSVRAPAPRRWNGPDVLRSTAVVTGYLLALLLVWLARDIFLTAFIGVLFGLAVSSGAARLERLRVPRGIGAALVVFGFIGVLVGIGAWIAPTLREQGSLLRARVPEAVDRLEVWLDRRPGLAGLLLGGRQVAQSRAASQDSAAIAEAQRAAAGTQDTTSRSSVPSLRQRVSQELSGVSRYLFPFLSSTITVAAGIFLIIVLSIYVGADPRLYHAGLMHLFPHGARPRAGVVLSRVAAVLRRWLVTQLIAMAVIGLVTTVVLLALGVKAAVALGLIAGLLEFVPTIGPILSSVPAIAMGFLDSPQKALVVAVAYLLIQQVENHLLIPLLMKEGMDLPPALTIVTQAVMALLFGFLGLLAAVPMLAAATVVVKMLYVERVIGDSVYTDDERADMGAAAPTPAPETG